MKDIISLHFVRETLTLYDLDKITLSRMTEMLNEKVHKRLGEVRLKKDCLIMIFANRIRI